MKKLSVALLSTMLLAVTPISFAATTEVSKPAPTNRVQLVAVLMNGSKVSGNFEGAVASGETMHFKVGASDNDAVQEGIYSAITPTLEPEGKVKIAVIVSSVHPSSVTGGNGQSTPGTSDQTVIKSKVVKLGEDAVIDLYDTANKDHYSLKVSATAQSL
jgi:hypothetical protein